MDSNTENNLSKFLPELIEIRRYIHAHPELSGQENRTAALISGELRKYGCRVTEGVGKTGVVAEIGPNSGPIIGVRVDIDALPVEERTGLEFTSLTEGIMHACGHDIHTCIGLGVAKIMSSKHPLNFGLRILFQPAEEIAKGACWMKNDGATENLDALFSVHVYPDLKVGQVGIRDGALTAAAGELEIEINGRGGHGARPHQTVDSILIASRIVTGIQEAVTRCFDPLNPVVISFGKISGGNAFNVIPDQVKLLGTVRYLDKSLDQKLPEWINQVCKDIAKPFGGNVQFKYRSIAPPVYNDPSLNQFLEESASILLGKENVVRLDKPSLGAEDFAELIRDIPGTMFRLGVAGPQGCAPLHNGEFCPDEKSILIGIEVLVKALDLWMMDKQI